jgi:hypothetical protein
MDIPQPCSRSAILALLVLEEATRAIGVPIDEIIVNAGTYETI